MRNLLKVAGFVVLAGCSGEWATSFDAPVDGAVSRNWAVRAVSVTVPEALTTSEDNSYTPDADIVWHGDPLGDRKAQAAAIVRTGITNGSRGLRGGTPVTLNVVLQEFHAVTPRARSDAPAAVHNIAYTIQAVNRRTGQALTEPVSVRADLEAFTGEEALTALELGETQKIRITRHLASVTAGWLGTGPDPRRTFTGPGR